MHGRVKVRTSEEQAAAKKLEREKKIQKYQLVTGEIQRKREVEELDEELLRLTEDLLSQNPDHYTVWNTRRDVILQLLAAASEEISKQELYKKELHFLELCLKVNPKSYGTFLHRRWVMSQIPSPNWKNEISLCDLFLSYDERNFHCWDYRRFAIHNAGIGVSQELEFSQKKLESNFSNYSAWHYRSKLLPLCYPSLLSPSSPSLGVQEEKLLQEFDLVTSAVFTDPNDQSAWFYQQWLLGRATQEQSILFLIHSPVNQILAVVFNQAVCDEVLKGVQVKSSEELAELQWKAHGSPPEWPSSVWTTPFAPQSCHSPLQCRFNSSLLTLTPSPSQTTCTPGSSGITGPAESLTAAKSDVIQAQCQSVCELLKLEPDNKWCHLTALQLRWAIDPEDNAAHIQEHFSALERLDHYRRAYYQDLRSRYLLEERVSRVLKQEEPSNLSLTGLGLTRLYHTQFFASLSSLDLSCNRLTGMAGLANLVSCQELNLSENLIAEVEEDILGLIQLRILNLKNNAIADKSSLHLLNKMVILEQLSLEGNPVLESTDSSQLTCIFSKLSIITGLNFKS